VMRSVGLLPPMMPNLVSSPTSVPLSTRHLPDAPGQPRSATAPQLGRSMNEAASSVTTRKA